MLTRKCKNPLCNNLIENHKTYCNRKCYLSCNFRGERNNKIKKVEFVYKCCGKKILVLPSRVKYIKNCNCKQCHLEIMRSRKPKQDSEDTKNKRINSLKKATWNFSEEEREKRRKRMLGNKNPSKKQYVKDKIRKSVIKKLKERFGEEIYPLYNPDACKIIDNYGKENGYNFQHAMNGGEYHIKELGYWVDGYDKENNIVVECYENRHKNQIEKDNIREKQIIDNLKCEFIIIKQWSKEWKKYLL